MKTETPIPNWKIQDFSPGEGASLRAFAPGFDDSSWLPAVAPGDVHSTLLAAGRIEDPFYDQNEGKCAWVEEREWWYRTTIIPEGGPLAEGDRFELAFDGLDTYATVWLNGIELGKARNMFHAQIFDVSDKIVPGAANTIAICFDRPLDHLEGFDISHWWEKPNAPRVAMRKAQYGYGWDWGPRLPTVGVWRGASLRRLHKATVRGVHFSTVELNRNEDIAIVAVKVEAQSFAGTRPVRANLTFSRGDTMLSKDFLLHPLPVESQSQPHKGALATNLGYEAITHAATVYITVEKPELWWTWDLGEPALYTLETLLEVDDTPVDSVTQQVGIRTIVLDQSPDTDEPGTRFFRFVINGVPIFARGANWIPTHSFVATVSKERYAEQIGAARFANMNMLRVWGGGIYESEDFYDECDRLGILVWQDFLFACAMYPENQQWYVDEVAAEARYQVRRLRSRASLALWCGNNENQDLHDGANWYRPGYYLPGQLYYNQILPDVVAALDGRIPYWPGSPFGGNNHNSQFDGDVHNWNAWHGNFFRQFGERPQVDQGPSGVSYRRYGEDLGRFISEFGLHAAPQITTLRKAIPEDQLWHHSPSMDHHNKDNPKNKGDNLMIQHTGLPNSLPEYIEYSMTAQAEGLKFAVEHYRQRKPHCSGTLIWQLNDCWPVLSWSVLDYYNVGKAGFWYLRRAFSPVLASFRENKNGTTDLWITNDLLTPMQDKITVALRTFGGETIEEHQIEINIAPNTSIAVLTHEQIEGAPDRYVSVHSSAGLFPANRHFFGEIREQAFPQSTPDVVYEEQTDGSLTVRLRAEGFVYFVHLLVDADGVEMSDNYIDLEPGVGREITVKASRPLTFEDVEVVWSLRQQ